MKVGKLNEIKRRNWIKKTLQNIPRGYKILDAGAGEQQYRKYCSHLKYVSQDLAQYEGLGNKKGLQQTTWEYGKLDIVSDIVSIPRPDKSFDAILCSEVLEHVPEPVKAIREFSRLLKPNGLLILTAPFCSLTHFAPFHYYTGFNRHFYETYLPKFGFEIIETRADGNYFEYLAQEIRRIPRVSKIYAKQKWSVYYYFIERSLLMFLAKLSKNDQGSSELLNFGYHILARKIKYTNTKSLISVILPVYNGEKYLAEAIKSILSQSYKRFELIIIDDGSKDRSLSIIKKFKDSRIRVYTQANKGLAETLNRGIKLARGAYIARQDQDDFSYPQRFEKQVNYLNTNQKCGLVGTWAYIWKGDRKKTLRFHKHCTENGPLQYFLLFNNPFVHSSVMIRKAALKKVGLYSTDKNLQPPEDYELWSRIAEKYELANIPELLHAYREIASSMSRSKLGFKSRVVKISAGNLSRALSNDFPDRDIYNLAALFHADFAAVKGKINLTTLFRELNSLSTAFRNKNGPLRFRLNIYEKYIRILVNYMLYCLIWR